MKTMRNEYRDLKKENDLIFSTLAEYDRDCCFAKKLKRL